MPIRLAILAIAFAPAAGAQDRDEAKDRPTAPSDYEIVASDRAGAYFAPRPLRERRDEVKKQLDALKADVDAARIDAATARPRLDRFQADLDEANRAIEEARVYVPGATARDRVATRSIPIGPDDLLLVDAEDIEIRGGDGPEVKCVLKKTVLGELGAEKDLSADFEGIAIEVRRASGKELFGYYKAAGDRPELRHAYDQFPFKPFLDREFNVVSIKGLTHDQGNRMISVQTTNAEGSGEFRNDWRRHAKLFLTVPRCRGIGVQGAAGGFRVHALKSPLMIQGRGNSDYQAHYEVRDLDGPLTALDFRLHRVDGIKGDVSIVATAYIENVRTSHDQNGVTMRPDPPRSSHYAHIRGDLTARFCRADLLLEGIEGRVDVQNDFGKTVWRADRPLASKAHRIVSQSGPIEVYLSPGAQGSLGLALFTECGVVRLPSGSDGLQSQMFHGNIGDVTGRAWIGFVSGDRDRRASPSTSLFTRIPAAVRGEDRTPGIDIISRAGTVTFEPNAGAAAGR